MITHLRDKLVGQSWGILLRWALADLHGSGTNLLSGVPLLGERGDNGA